MHWGQKIIYMVMLGQSINKDLMQFTRKLFLSHAFTMRENWA